MNEEFLDDLLEQLGGFAYKPLEFVYWAFPWGEENTELAKFSGPDEWQIEILRALQYGLIDVSQAVQIAVASGHGIGKSALVAWIVLWAFCTAPDTRGVVTANTENQLKTKTWVEIAKWTRLSIFKDLFKLTATALFSKDEERQREWRIDIVPWSERNTEAFAGLHNQGKRILIIFDEASAIPDLIWETTEGALTDEDTEIIWIAFGNPTRNEYRFRECFEGGKFSHRWLHKHVDSRTVKITNKAQLAKWEADYGEDSDFFRVRVRGEFPLHDEEAFISRELAEAAALRRPQGQDNYPVVLGVDVARFGSDFSVIYPRQGLDAQSRAPLRFSKIDTMEFASRVLQAMHFFNAAACFVDVTGLGAGVYDRLIQLKVNAYPVGFSEKPYGINPRDPQIKYANRRAEIWGGMKDSLMHGLCIRDEIVGADRSLPQQLAGPTYSYVRDDRILLESKELMARRGVASPDDADALACTFALPDLADFQRPNPTAAKTPEYNPFAIERIYG